MGRRRKERRIAAASGRRVILDLSAEPSGELGSSSAQDEDGGAEDAKKVAGLPSSPSSSGKPENPLALLGQYSDDELDDGSSPEKDQAIAEVSRDDSCDESQDKGQNDATTAGHLQVEEGNSLLNSIEKSEAGVDAGIVNTGADEALVENYLTGKAIAASTSYLQDGDVCSGWKTVLHEESNQYYYWNVATGETSWTVPDALLEATANDTVNYGEEAKAFDAFYSVGPNFEMTDGRDQRVTSEMLIEDALDGQKIDAYGTQNHPESATGNLTSCVLEHGELLLEKLHSIKGDPFHGHSRVQSYLSEVEMRLADMKSLACHGSSLLPFWELSESRLQQLEANINSYLQEIKAKKVEEIASTDLYPESSVPATDIDSKENKAVSASGDTYAQELAGRVEHLDNVETDIHLSTRGEHVTSERHLTGYSGNASEEDMDVDMEVEEDAAPLNNLGVTSEPLGVPDLASASLGNSPSGEGIPPPPDEDWIPPPPPDDEPFPPPPPDEPPEVPYPQSSDLVSAPSYPYLEQYNVYPGSHYQYVAQTSADVASGHVYAHPEGYHPPAVSQPPVYFGALPDTYATATLAVNPVETGLYYGIQDPAQQPFVQLPVLNHLGSSSANGDLDYASIPKGDGEGSVASGNSPNATLEPLATMPVAESASSIPASTATTSTSLSPSKAQPKVLRKKKKTVAVVSSLRSNKKVSSLVDKWKAAKEEMQEEEKEPENPLEILERKRQREIEEWRKQQIASGEAKENANFQPLGGDWRERVKRKRAKLAKEAVQSPSESVSEVNPQPNNLDEHSKGLPKGWQAFWDDSTKQVYYGNTLTSKTSWTRPTD